ncbi:glycoside hydrolase family 16 protein [Altibacter sp. HG106]|uniref:glycoside hydrolase family 16 protein n=1 Tax=Altibacter sp. HG106 TaxID=3023937 RepID=UPI002351055D|nr:glycoside hydrolase family 16 protein [Altibacter sp. HG106]MDC7996076.1 glycoside hydrolase family 16 protein [Altibacter sp. HG106]
MKILWIFLTMIAFINCRDASKTSETSKTSEASPLKIKDTLYWSDEFNGKQLDTLLWNYETGAHGWGNQEWQNYTAGDNVEVSDGTLKITARKVGKGQQPGDYTSTRLTSKDTFQYGRMEVRLKVPKETGPGLWPAAWMLGYDIETIGWPDCGEIDLMEYVSYDLNHVHMTFHTAANNHLQNTQITTGPMVLETIEESFHTYGILWSAQAITFYIDDPTNTKLRFTKPDDPTTANWPFDKPYFFLLNMAVGGAWGGQEGVDDTIFPATFEIDYVRVYR